MLYEVVLAPGEGVISADEDAETVVYERIDGSRLEFSIPVGSFEANIRGFAATGRSSLGGGGSDFVNAARWLNFVMMEKANDMSPVGRRGYQLLSDGWMVPWD